MRLVTFDATPNQPRIGAVSDSHIVDLNLACQLYFRGQGEPQFRRLAQARVPAEMRAFFAGGEPALATAREALRLAAGLPEEARGPGGERLRYPLAGTPLRAPIQPKKFFHTAGNFREHDDEARRAGFSHPVLPWIMFFQNVDAIIGPEAPVIYPEHLTHELDYEIELAVVIKKDGKHFGAEAAGDYIGGYVIFNDITARDVQRQEMKSGVFSFCKAIDSFCPLGPWIVTAEEIPDPHSLAMELRVNGESRQRSHTSKMSVRIPEILAHYSATGYSAGDVVSTGTVSGVAAFSGDPQRWYLRPGDVVECEIERIGVLRNPVISWQNAYGAAAGGPA